MSVNLGSQFMLSMHDVKVHRPMSLVSETFHWTNTLWVSALGLANKKRWTLLQSGFRERVCRCPLLCVYGGNR